MAGMGKVGYRYVVEDIDRHGNVRLYFRKAGLPKVRLPPIDSDAFRPAYRRACEGLTRPHAPAPKPADRLKKGSLYSLAAAYRASAEFATLALTTRDMRRRLLDDVLDEPVNPNDPADTAKLGDCAANLVTRSHVLKIRDRHADRPEGANNRAKVLSQLYGWAVKRQEVEGVAYLTNPCAGIVKLTTGSEGIRTWTVEEVKAFLKRWPSGTMARLAIELLLHGLRRSDVVRIGRQHMTPDGGLEWTHAKGATRRPVRQWIEIGAALKAEIAKVPKDRLTFLATPKGQAFSPKGFGNVMRRWCDKAGLKGLSAHGLRKAAATLAAERGASVRVLNTLFGWSGTQQAQRYTEAADRKRLARLGAPMIEIERERPSNKNVPPKPAVAKGGTKTRRK